MLPILAWRWQCAANGREVFGAFLAPPPLPNSQLAWACIVVTGYLAFRPSLRVAPLILRRDECFSATTLLFVWLR